MQSIETYSFHNLKITSVIIPASLKSFGSNALSKYSLLTSLTFEPNCLLTNLPLACFAGCDLRTFLIPPNVRTISATCFNDNTNMNSINVDTMNIYFTSDGKAIYSNSNTLIYCASNVGTTFTVPSNVPVIGEGAFVSSQCQTIILPNELKEIKYFAFANSKITRIDIPDSVTDIASSCFISCPNLEYVKLPINLKSINASCFKACSSLKSIVIPDNVTVIEKNAFANCPNLVNVTLPKNLQELGGGVFENSPKVNLMFAEGSQVSINDQGLIIDKDELYISQCVNAEATTIQIPNTVTIIKKSAFKGKSKLQTLSLIDVTSSLTTIEEYAFYGCTSLTSIPDISQVTSFGLSCFHYCNLQGSLTFSSSTLFIDELAFAINKNIQELHFNNAESITISKNAFSSCISISSLTFPTSSSVKKLMSLTQLKLCDFCFYNCPNIQSITLPGAVTTLGASCFRNTGLNFISFKGNVLGQTDIPSYCFQDCISLTSFSFPSNVDTIGTGAFINTSISELNLPDSIKSLKPLCFSNCLSLRSLTISSNSLLESIGNGVFKGCTQFRSISPFENRFYTCMNSAIYNVDLSSIILLPPAYDQKFFSFSDRVRIIEDGTFSGCKNLELVLIPDNSIETIGSSAFEYCTNLISINIPKCVQSIGVDAFIGCDRLKCGSLLRTRHDHTPT